jgi:multiple sugar transport system substrate-binding protein
VSDAINERKGDFIPSTLETAEYEGKYWGVPYHSNAGFVYYRTDQLDEAPATWEDLYEAAEANDGFVYQGARYEGLTVNFLELLYSAGGKVLSDDGQSVEIDSPEAEEALTFMVEGIDSGAAKKAVTTYKEEESRRAFESGNSSVMRNWPYAYSLGKDSDIADDFDIGNFPSFGGSEGASVLGGFNLGISAYSKNPEAALAFVNFATGPEVQKANFVDAANPPATAGPYDDPEVQDKIPFAADLKKAIEQGQARPVSPVYPQISQAIYENVHDALQGKTPPKEALTTMKSEIEKALQTF